MIKIIHIGQPHTGVGTYIKTIIENIDCDRFDSILIADIKDSTRVRDEKGSPIRSFYVPFAREISPVKDFRSLVQSIAILKKEKPHVIHAHSSKCGYIGRLAGKILGIPVLYTPNAFSYLSATPGIKSSLYKFIEIAGKHTGALLLACSKSEADRGLNDLSYREDKVKIWNNSINDVSIPSVKVDNGYGKYICSIGRPSYQKNQQVLINVFNLLLKKYPELKLVIVGAGYFSPEKSDVLDQISRLGIQDRVTILDHVERDEALTILHNSILYAMSSRYEGLPFSVIEALCLSKPCVLTDVDGNKDCVTDGENGFLVKDFNENEMADKITKILSSDDLKVIMGKKSRQKFEDDFDIAKNILNLEKIYMDSI